MQEVNLDLNVEVCRVGGLYARYVSAVYIQESQACRHRGAKVLGWMRYSLRIAIFNDALN